MQQELHRQYLLALQWHSTAMTRASVHQIATAASLGIPLHLLLPVAHLTLQIMVGTQLGSAPAVGHLLRGQVVAAVQRPNAHASTKDCRFPGAWFFVPILVRFLNGPLHPSLLCQTIAFPPVSHAPQPLKAESERQKCSCFLSDCYHACLPL